MKCFWKTVLATGLVAIAAQVASPRAANAGLLHPQAAVSQNQQTAQASTNPEQAAMGLYHAWRSNHYQQAAYYATPDVVNQLFDTHSDYIWVFKGCQGSTCNFETRGGGVQVQTQPILGSRTPHYKVTNITFMHV